VNETRHRDVGDYLRRLQRSLAGLPVGRRDEIVGEIEGHIAAELAAFSEPTHADVRNVLERIGTPEDIADEARERFGIRPPRRRWTDVAAIILLLVGGFTVIGWFVGVVLLWISDVWSTRDKLIGTLIVPGGLAGGLGVALAFGSAGCTVSRPIGGPIRACEPASSLLAGPLGLILGAVIVIAPIMTAVYLGRRLSHARADDVDDISSSAGGVGGRSS
jgi:hypothetical protein